ncbi:hypothetical protein SUGI_0210820 [Cryptomeria japonica]|uniref:F-box/kelch-repeat protein At1g80440-like n=1 Tax=Cryptomeria japonica TaxID=3369 RepID=UPI002408E4EB|nr:F-box/kelch-repeat protein At1g80440-like [Cryptomeria japonica]GLJ13372.1 hypothetical protein SUGI_0210820 [Cryptomeria japonica]
MAMGSLFPRLPDEIGFECLLRVELNSHHNLRCVCKSWNAALKNPRFYQERKRLKISEQRICMAQKIDGNWDIVVYDLEKNSCKSLPPIPQLIYGTCHCHVVKQKLILIGNTFRAGGGNCLLLYDFACSKWREGAGMPDWRERFASAADEERGLIYVGGGFNCRFGLTSASVYNVEEDRWDLLPNMNSCMDGFTGVFADSKFYVMDHRFYVMENHYRTTEVFDSYTRSWKTIENRFNSVSVCLFDRLYCFSGMGLIEYDYRQDKWNIVETFPTEDWHFIVFAVVVRHNIFICILDRIRGQTFYMLRPPSERGGGGAFKWTAIEKPLGLQGSAIHAATLDL